jgi:hypothetical protein
MCVQSVRVAIASVGNVVILATNVTMLNIKQCWVTNQSFHTLTEVFPCLFLSCKANARVKPAKMGHGPYSSQIFVLFYVLFVLCRSVYCLCVNVY